jgi:hypothetical protein
MADPPVYGLVLDVARLSSIVRDLMLLFITAPGHSYTVKALVERNFGADTPPCQVTTYDAAFYAKRTVQATHIFTDMERLYDWELVLAGDLYRSISDAGLPCLNNPAQVMCRYELLRKLHAAGINPFTVYRADDRPQPARFPVFLRFEADHGVPVSDLLPDQAALDAHLLAMREGGFPLRGMIVVEYASEPIAPGVWQQFGTFRVGDAVLVDHAVSDDNWLVKYGKRGLATDAMFADEKVAVTTNRFAEELRPAFEIAGVEWGRADHAAFNGCQIVYEINTNPEVQALLPQRSPIRDETLRFGRQRMAEQLWRLDFGNGAPLSFSPGEALTGYRSRGWPSIRP